MTSLCRSSSLACLVLSASLLALACSRGPAAATTAPAGSVAPTATAAGQPDPDATVTWAMVQLHNSMDPHSTTSATTANAHRAVFDPLLWPGKGGVQQPRLALEWRVLEPTVWQFKLRPNVTFHNGEPLDATAIKWNFDRLKDTSAALAASTRVASLREVVVVDPLTVNFVTVTPVPIWPEYARLIAIVPPRYIQQVGIEAFERRPVGTGPFRFVSMGVGTDFVGERNEQYWAGAPRFKQIRMVALPEAATRIAALRSGAVDMVERVGSTEADRLTADGFTIHEYISGLATGVFFDTQQESPVQKREVRLALNYAFDKDQMMRLGGRGLAVGQIGHPDSAGWNPDIKPFPYDPARARQLMGEGGYPNGYSMKMHVASGATGFASVDMAQFLQQSWQREINVRIELDIIESAVMSAMFGRGGYHPMRLTSQGFGEEVAFVLQFFDYAGQRVPVFRRYRNDQFDQVWAASNREFDPAKRHQLLQEAARILHEDGAIVFTANESSTWAYSNKIQNFRLTSGGHMDWASMVKTR